MPTGPGVLAALYGPTSSGKTKLSVQVAQRIERELGAGSVVIIQADSRQVYRHLDIGTSKTRPDEMGGIRHEMIDVADAVRKLELEDYTSMARQHIERALAGGQVPFVVGGTGIYVKALLEGWEVERTGAARDALRRDFPRSMAEDAYAMLRRLDRAAAERVSSRNYEAVINALAGVMAPSGATATAPASPRPRQVVLGLDPAQQLLDQRVAATYDDQVRRGLFDEIGELDARWDLDRELRARGKDSRNQVLHTHGYREYFEVAAERGKPVTRLTPADLAEVRSRVVDHIQQYSRRQRSFLRKLPAVRVVRPTDAGQAASLILRPTSAAVKGRS